MQIVVASNKLEFTKVCQNEKKQHQNEKNNPQTMVVQRSDIFTDYRAFLP
jgi:hypothetical protein